MNLHSGNILIPIALAALAASPLSAKTFEVTSTDDSGNGTLRQAILDANGDNDAKIEFRDTTGVITLASPLPVITANVKIHGPGTNALTISGDNKYTIFGTSAGTTCVLSGLTIANAYAEGQVVFTGRSFETIEFNGCAISNAGSLTVLKCVITNCINEGNGPEVYGGAIYSSGPLVMRDSIITDSGASGEETGVEGGCIYATCSLRMANCFLSNCRADDTPGIVANSAAVLDHCTLTSLVESLGEGNGGALAGTNMTLISCVISNCEAGYEGGAFLGNNLTARDTVFTGCGSIFEGGGFYIAGTNFFYNCTITGCASGNYGGGAMKNFGNTTFVDCTLSSNAVFLGNGSAIYNLGVIKMTNCTISGNTATLPTPEGASDGGAINNSTVDIEFGTTFTNVAAYLMDCTIVSNAVGGGIQNQAGATIYVRDTIIADNGTNDFTGALDSDGYNLIKNVNGCAITGTTTGNIYDVDPLLGPLQNNGGLTMTHALLPGSPAIGTGPVGGLPRFDQRGVLRPRKTAGDIGAYEVSACTDHFLTLTQMGAGFQVTLNGVPGVNYYIQRASFPSGTWTIITNITVGFDGTGVCLDSPAAGSAFYRSILSQ